MQSPKILLAFIAYSLICLSTAHAEVDEFEGQVSWEKKACPKISDKQIIDEAKAKVEQLLTGWSGGPKVEISIQEKTISFEKSVRGTDVYEVSLEYARNGQRRIENDKVMVFVEAPNCKL